MHQLLLKPCLNVFGIFAESQGLQGSTVSQFLQQRALCAHKWLGRSTVTAWPQSPKHHLMEACSCMLIVFNCNWHIRRSHSTFQVFLSSLSLWPKFSCVNASWERPSHVLTEMRSWGLPLMPVTSWAVGARCFRGNKPGFLERSDK